MNGQIYNFWQDAAHAHGLWRRTTLQDYRRPNTSWTSVLDLDALSATEKGNWFWGGASCAEPAERLCMIALSDGGEDATTEREFDLRSAKFVGGGFSLPKGKQTSVWENENSLLVSREWAPGELTTSGYPYIVKRVARGKPLSEAKELFRGTRSDVGASPFVLNDGAGHQVLGVLRDVTFFESEVQLLTPQGLKKLALPRKASLTGLIAGRLIVELREDWKAGEGASMPQGALVAIDLSNALATPDHLRPTLVYEPGARKSFAEASAGRDFLLVTELDNVRGRAYVYTPEKSGGWSHRALALADNATIEIVDTDLHSNQAFLSVTGFLMPSSLWLADLKGERLAVVKTLPAKFDATGLKIEQLEAVSQRRHPGALLRRAPERHQARRQHAHDHDGLRRLSGFRDAVLFGDQWANCGWSAAGPSCSPTSAAAASSVRPGTRRASRRSASASTTTSPRSRRT